MTMVVGAAHALAQLAATLVFADTGPLPSRIYLYAHPDMATGATPYGAPIAEITLAKPCGTLTAGSLTLHTAGAGGMVLQDGTPHAAQWVNGEGDLVAAGTVTDMANGGDFRISGAPTTPGNDAPTLYTGGLVTLGTVVLD